MLFYFLNVTKTAGRYLMPGAIGMVQDLLMTGIPMLFRCRSGGINCRREYKTNI